MKKLSLLVGTIGSTAAWYILSNKKLRHELGKAKTPEDTVKVLSGYLGRDAAKIGAAVHEWFHSEEVQGTITKAKDVAEQTMTGAKKGLSGLVARARRAKDSLMKPPDQDA